MCVCVCAVLLLLLLLLLIVRRHRQHHECYAAVGNPDDDIRENIIHYDEEGVGEEDHNSYDIDRLKKPVEVDSTVSLPSTTDTTAPRIPSYVSDVTSGFRCTHCGLFRHTVINCDTYLLT